MIGQLDSESSFEGRLDQFGDLPAIAGQVDIAGVDLGEQPVECADAASSLTAARAGDAARIACRSASRLERGVGFSVTSVPVVSFVTVDIMSVIVVLSQDRPLTQTI